MPHPDPKPDFRTLLLDHDPTIQAIAEKTRELVRTVQPNAHEEVEPAWGGYLLFKQTPNGGNTVCFLSAHKKHVSLGFSQGAELSDPAGLLQGSGKHQRHLKLKSEAEVGRAEVRALVEEAWRRCLAGQRALCFAAG